MKTCRHFDTTDGVATSLIKDKQNHHYICSKCLHQFTENEYRYMREYCDVLNILNKRHENESNTDDSDGATCRLIQLQGFIPRSVSYEDTTY